MATNVNSNDTNVGASTAPSTSTSPPTDPASATTSASSTTQQKPKIDPLQLLKCLSILLNLKGGIRGMTEVTRVQGLMAKYSKKLVSKCIYLNILQATDLELLDAFYEEGGWELVGLWLQEAVNGKNWPLANQVLSLLETSPVTVSRLKRNTTPKLVKELSRDASASQSVQTLAKHLVLKWMDVVRQGDGIATAAGVGLASASTTTSSDQGLASSDSPKELTTNGDEKAKPERGSEATTSVDGVQNNGQESPQAECGDGSSSGEGQDDSSNASSESDNTPAITTPIRITIRSGSQVLAKVSSQRLSQDSNDSDDNKPLSVIKQEVMKARLAAKHSRKQNATGKSIGVVKVDTKVPKEAESTTMSDTATSLADSVDISETTPMSVAPSAATTNVVVTKNVTTSAITTSIPKETTASTTTTTIATSAVHTIVTFTGDASAASTSPTSSKQSPSKDESAVPTETKDSEISTKVVKSEVDDDDKPIKEETEVESVSSDVKSEKSDVGKDSEMEEKCVKNKEECVEKKEESGEISDENKDKSNDNKESKEKVDSDVKSDEVDSKEKSEKDESESKSEKDKRTEKSKDKDKSRDRDRDKERDREKERERDKKSRDSDRRKDRDESRSSKSSSSSRSDKERSSKDSSDKSRSDRHKKDSRDKDRSKSSSSSSSSSRDKSRDRDKDRDKHRDKDKDRSKDKEKKGEKKDQQEKEDKATLEKVKPLSADGLAKIPRKQSSTSFLDALGSADLDLLDAKKPSVKTYKSRGFRNTGLLDEPTKLPGVAGKKAPTSQTEKKPPVGLKPGIGSTLKRPSTMDSDLSPSQPKSMRLGVGRSPQNIDKPGGAKLISPKRPSLSDDGGFMAALTAAGPDTRKKVGRKRKSSEGDPKEEKKEDEKDKPTTPPGKAADEKGMLSPTSVKPTFNFYKDTLKDDEDGEKKENSGDEAEEEEAENETNHEEEMETETKEKDENTAEAEMKEETGDQCDDMDIEESEDNEISTPGNSDGDSCGGVIEANALRDEDIPLAPAAPAPVQEEYEKVEVTFSAPQPVDIRSVLVYHRSQNRKKKTVKWKGEDDLQQVFYFELDETERVNVNTIKFNEMMALEKQNEREAFTKKNRLMQGGVGIMGGPTLGMSMDDLGMSMNNVHEYMRWSLLPVTLTEQPSFMPGAKSEERHIQARRESSTIPAFYHPAMLPDSPREPDPEMVQRMEAKDIPLHDITGQDNIFEYRNKPWPEPIINDPMNFGYGPMGGMGNMGGMRNPPGGGGGGSHWVVGGPPSNNFGGGHMYVGPPGGPVGPGGPMGPVGPVGPGGPGGPGPGGPGGPGGFGPGMGGPGNFVGDMGGGMDGPGWGGMGPEYPGQNMMMGGGNQGMMMGARPNLGGPRNMMPNMGMGGGGPRFPGRGGPRPSGGGWGPRGTPPVCKHFMNGHCRHGKSCKFLHDLK